VCSQGAENESARHQRMQPEPFPNHKIKETGENPKSRRPFFRSLLGYHSATSLDVFYAAETTATEDVRDSRVHPLAVWVASVASAKGHLHNQRTRSCPLEPHLAKATYPGSMGR